MSNILFSGVGATGSSSFVTVLVIYAVVIGGLYLLFFRPQQKKKKQEEAMRNDLQIGDEITTIGGIMGKVVSIKDESDSIVIETGIDRSKVRIRRWAIASRDTVRETEQK